MENQIVLSQSAEIARIEIDMQVATAKQYPRDEEKVIKKVHKLATLNKEISCECFYSKPVGEGKTATGESIRFAEIVSSVWGNLRIKTYIKEETSKNIVAVAEGVDNETNTAISCEVSRSITTKSGYRYSESQIEVTKLAAQAIARRNVIFQLIPKGLFSETIEKIKDFSVGKNEQVSKDAFLTSVKKVLQAFKKYKIEENVVFEKIGVKSVEEITQDLLKDLIGFGTALKEGATVEDIFGKSDIFGIEKEVNKENLFDNANS